jgi:hypothetical protein
VIRDKVARIDISKQNLVLQKLINHNNFVIAMAFLLHSANHPIIARGYFFPVAQKKFNQIVYILCIFKFIMLDFNKHASYDIRDNSSLS